MLQFSGDGNTMFSTVNLKNWILIKDMQMAADFKKTSEKLFKL